MNQVLKHRRIDEIIVRRRRTMIHLSPDLVWARPINDARQAARIAAELLKGCLQESFLALHLNTRHHVVGFEEIARGGQNAVHVHPCDVFRGAIVTGVPAIILAHNHPSGDPTPSAEDRDLTERLNLSGRLLAVQILDHLVVGETSFYSFTTKSISHFAPIEARLRAAASSL
jgi:DNA repair protein RadC